MSALTLETIQQRKLDEYNGIAAQLAGMRDRQDNLTDAELSLVAVLRERKRKLGLELDDLKKERQHDAAVDALAQRISPAARTPYEQAARVYHAERTYRPDDAQRGAPTFLTDLFRGQVLHDPAANERLSRHGHEVEVDRPELLTRASTTGNVSGFVPPAYLTDLWAELARAGRPVANLCTRMPLPEAGMTVNIPRVTTGTSTGVQTAENASLATQDIDDTLLTVNVNTIAGYTDVSRQAIERGIGVEQLVLTDLASDYNSKLDAQVINGSGSSGQHLGLLNVSGTNLVTYTDASPTVPELWPKLADAVRQIVSQRYSGATGIVMTPLTWGWLLAATDTSGRPLIDASANGSGQNTMGTSATPQYNGAAGTVFGIPVWLSGNLPANLGAGTNETRIIAADFRDTVLFEDNGGAPVQLRFDAPLSSSLGVRLLAYGYSAFAGGRQPKAISVVGGTGLILPSL